MAEPTASTPAAGDGSRPSLRDRKKDATRQTIEDAAWELFSERGYDATTVQDIADRANVAPRTFFRYFPTKEAVLYPELDDVMAELAAAFAARPAEEPALVALVAAMDAIADELGDEQERKFQRFEMLKRAGHAASSGFVTARVADAVAQMVRDRARDQPECELQARLAAGILSVVMTISNEEWVETAGQTTIESEAKRCFETIRHLVGVTTEMHRPGAERAAT